MKKSIVSVFVAAACTAAMGQSRVDFNNITSFFGFGQGAVTVETDLAKAVQPDGGARGAYVGSQYSVQLLWKAGTFGDVASFLAASPSSSTPVAFYGSTGGNPSGDGAGIFDGGSVALGGPGGVYTMLVRVWYNGGSYGSYDAALTAGKNVGQSPLFTMNATEPPTPPNPTIFPSFTVWVIPEPGTLALGGLGLAALFLLRRRS